eukprot:Skav228271  [mRNA]  locus=scaffold5658:27351:28750:- [translate_table: standard]
MKDFRPPQAVASHLRPYQLAGFRWLACLCKNGLGAVLADDMGLGKTLQWQAGASHLRPYQLAGFRWLACLCKNGLGAVLADDMGLGKTLQCISVLLYMKEQSLLTNEQNEKCPALVVVPPGLLQNWQRELAQWAPSLSFYVYHGPKRSLPENKGKAPADYDLLLTTYEMVRNDRAKLADARVIAFCGGWAMGSEGRYVVQVAPKAVTRDSTITW